MPKGYRAYFPDQDFLLPPSLGQWLPERHLAYFVSDVVDQLDLTPMHAEYGEEKPGQPPYDPRMMTKLLDEADPWGRPRMFCELIDVPRQNTYVADCVVAAAQGL